MKVLVVLIIELHVPPLILVNTDRLRLSLQFFLSTFLHFNEILFLGLTEIDKDAADILTKNNATQQISNIDVFILNRKSVN